MKMLLPAALLLSLSGCYEGYNRGVVNQPMQAAPAACKRQEVYCSLSNFSRGDTLLVAPAKLVIDDSLVVAEQIPRSLSASDHIDKRIRICEGVHRIHMQFGPYTSDTTFTVSQSQQSLSLLITVICRDIPELAHEDGLNIATLVLDGKSGPD